MLQHNVTIGPVIVTVVPGYTAGQTTVYVVVKSMSGNHLAQQALSAFNPQFNWSNAKAGEFSVSGKIIFQLGFSEGANTLYADYITWQSHQNNTPQHFSGVLFKW